MKHSDHRRVPSSAAGLAKRELRATQLLVLSKGGKQVVSQGLGGGSELDDGGTRSAGFLDPTDAVCRSTRLAVEEHLLRAWSVTRS